MEAEYQDTYTFLHNLARAYAVRYKSNLTITQRLKHLLDSQAVCREHMINPTVFENYVIKYMDM